MISESLDYTGERMVPEGADNYTFWEHVYRYRFAALYAPGARVLDIACGEGYGSASLKAAGAESVTGVDISPETVEHARRKYGIDARVGNAEAIPLEDNSVDLLVSFETLEHVPNPEKFVEECRRVLSPGGTLIISTPNKDVYTERIGYENPFHCSELSRGDFLKLLGKRFSNIDLYTQRPTHAPWWSPRWLAAEHSPAFHLRGPRWIGRTLRRAMEVDYSGEVPAAARESVVQTILRQDQAGAGLVNPFAIRKPAWVADTKPLYFLAVARLAKSA